LHENCSVLIIDFIYAFKVIHLIVFFFSYPNAILTLSEFEPETCQYKTQILNPMSLGTIFFIKSLNQIALIRIQTGQRIVIFFIYFIIFMKNYRSII
jgi:hypothetical protein